MAPKKIKLIYFDNRGRGEVIRLVLAAAGQEYEDIRLTQQTWPAEKPNTPFGQIPCIELDGQRFGQTVAIANYLAREYGFYGKSNLDALMIDQVVQLTQDFIAVIIKAMFEPDEAKKAELSKKLKEEEVPKYLSYFETLLQENGKGFFLGSSVTLADIVVYDIIDTLRMRDVGTIDMCPALQELVKNVEGNDNIKAYLASRKQNINDPSA